MTLLMIEHLDIFSFEQKKTIHSEVTNLFFFSFFFFADVNEVPSQECDQKALELPPAVLLSRGVLGQGQGTSAVLLCRTAGGVVTWAGPNSEPLQTSKKYHVSAPYSYLVRLIVCNPFTITRPPLFDIFPPLYDQKFDLMALICVRMMKKNPLMPNDALK